MLEPLLAELHRHQTDLTERIRIVEEADRQIEAAIERVRAVLGNGPGGAPQDALEEVARSPVPADPSAPLLDAPAGPRQACAREPEDALGTGGQAPVPADMPSPVLPARGARQSPSSEGAVKLVDEEPPTPPGDPVGETRSCPECGAGFTQARRTGAPQIYCGDKCRRTAAARRAQLRAQAAVVEPPAPEPDLQPRQCAYCESLFKPTTPEQKYCDRECKKGHRERNRASFVPLGDDAGYLAAMRASGGWFE